MYIELYLIYDTCNSSFESWSCSQLQLSYIFMKFHWMFSRHSNFDKLLKYPICHLFRGSKIQCLWIPQSTLIIDPRWSIQNDWYYYCIIVLAAFFVSMTGYSTCTRRTIRWSRWWISLKQVLGLEGLYAFKYLQPCAHAQGTWRCSTTRTGSSTPPAGTRAQSRTSPGRRRLRWPRLLHLPSVYKKIFVH